MSRTLLVSKWKGKYEAKGAAALRLRHQESEGYLREEDRHEILQWIGAHKTVSVEVVRDYIEERCGSSIIPSHITTYGRRGA